MKSFKFLALVCLVIACFFCCKEDPKKDINEYATFVQQMNDKGIRTSNILVYKNGEVVFKNADGIKNYANGDTLTIASEFRLASVSKQFTGMAIMKLKEAGKLDYDQKVNTILEDFPYEDITVRHLLHHTSGLKDYMNIMQNHWEPQDSTKSYILGNDEVIKVFYEVNPDLDFNTGEKYAYSNSGYMFLASIVEKISGQHFRDFLKEQITDPIGMDNTYLYDYQIEEDAEYPNRVYGYEKTLNQVDLKANDYSFINGVRGDGGIYSTLDDLYKWNMALANYSIISKAYIDEAWTSGKLNNGEDTGYGFGFGIKADDDQPKSVSHSGGWVGFVTYLYNEYSTKSGYIVLSNNSGEYFGDILGGVNNIYKGKPYELSKQEVIYEMAKLIMTEDIDKGINYYHSVKADTINYAVSERALNYLGYRFLREDHLDNALGIFKLNTAEYPDSANTYDSYGEALLVKGDSIKALENFKRCVKMDSTFVETQERIKKLELALGL